MFTKARHLFLLEPHSSSPRLPTRFFQIYFNNILSNYVSVLEVASFLLASLVNRIWRVNLRAREDGLPIFSVAVNMAKGRWRKVDRG